MTNEEAIALLKSGSETPDIPHTSEMLDEACKLACRALKKPPNLCVILGVWPEQVFNWRGYTLKVRSDGVVGKKMVGNSWPSLEGPMVCELINNADEIMRRVQLDLIDSELLAKVIRSLTDQAQDKEQFITVDEPDSIFAQDVKMLLEAIKILHKLGGN